MNAQTALAQLALVLAEVSQQRDQANAAVAELSQRVQALEAAVKAAEPETPAADAWRLQSVAEGSPANRRRECGSGCWRHPRPTHRRST